MAASGETTGWAGSRPAMLQAGTIPALAGGGDHGAFGAGVLTGWSEAGTRNVNLRSGSLARERHTLVIRNARFGSDWQETPRSVLTIAGRAILNMIACRGRNDAMRLQVQAERDGIRFNLAHIGDDFPLPWQRPFDRAWTDSYPALVRDPPAAPSPRRR